MTGEFAVYWKPLTRATPGTARRHRGEPHGPGPKRRYKAAMLPPLGVIHPSVETISLASVLSQKIHNGQPTSKTPRSSLIRQCFRH